jgi:hypothetical protein
VLLDRRGGGLGQAIQGVQFEVVVGDVARRHCGCRSPASGQAARRQDPARPGRPGRMTEQ